VKFSPTGLPGAFLIEPECSRDGRGSFARLFCAREYEQHGLVPRLAQCSESRNSARGTLRGLHYQAAPHLEAKTVRCTAGAIFDVIVDLRRESATRWRWFGVELSPARGAALYVPPGFAHGFITLQPDSTVEYLISEFYVPEAARGVRYDDPTLAVRWPIEPQVISDRDRSLPLARDLDG
jgi:dTDP-4-dehydrorhamnose 3,5-epimerase